MSSIEDFEERPSFQGGSYFLLYPGRKSGGSIMSKKILPPPLQKGNTIEHKGNTTEKLCELRTHQSIKSNLFDHKGNTKRETLVWRFSQ